MKRVTRNIELSEARDLLEHSARACLAFASHAGPVAEPVTVVFDNDRYLVGMPSDTSVHPAVREEAVLLVDEGVQYFDLRAIYVRGVVASVDGVQKLSADLAWLALEPTKIVAWDYGRMREVDHDS